MKYKLKVMDRYKYYWNLICESPSPEDIVTSLSPYMIRIGIIYETELDKSRLGRAIGNIRIIDCHYAGDVIRGRFA